MGAMCGNGESDRHTVRHARMGRATPFRRMDHHADKLHACSRDYDAVITWAEQESDHVRRLGR